MDRDTYLVAGITYHLCPWQSCYRSTQLLSGSRRFVLSTSGHIAAMVDPPGNEKARYQVAKENPEDPQEWLRHAENGHGSWWPDYASWLAEPRKDPAVARDLLHLTSRLGPARGYCYQLLSGIGWTSLPWLRRLRPPTLILAGDDDPIIPLANARIMYRLIPRSQLHVYAGGAVPARLGDDRLA